MTPFLPFLPNQSNPQSLSFLSGLLPRPLFFETLGSHQLFYCTATLDPTIVHHWGPSRHLGRGGSCQISFFSPTTKSVPDVPDLGPIRVAVFSKMLELPRPIFTLGREPESPSRTIVTRCFEQRGLRFLFSYFTLVTLIPPSLERPCVVSLPSSSRFKRLSSAVRVLLVWCSAIAFSPPSPFLFASHASPLSPPPLPWPGFFCRDFWSKSLCGVAPFSGTRLALVLQFFFLSPLLSGLQPRCRLQNRSLRIYMFTTPKGAFSVSVLSAFPFEALLRRVS